MEGRAYRYTATASREEYGAGLMREAPAGGDDTEAVLSHFAAQMGGPESEVLRSVVRRLAGGPDEAPVVNHGGGTRSRRAERRIAPRCGFPAVPATALAATSGPAARGQRPSR
jgi:hypothetical protein